MNAANELLLLRHGEAESPPTGRDLDRALTERGQRQANVIGRSLCKHGRPELIVSSPAARARETSEIICTAMQHALSSVQWEHRIYDASLDTLLELLAGFVCVADPVLIVGHNPGLSYLLDYLCDDSGPGAALGTGSLARIGLPRDSALSQGSGTLLRRIDP